MNIDFLPDVPAYRDANLTVNFPCSSMVGACRAQFRLKHWRITSASRHTPHGLDQRIRRGRPRIEAVAREHLRVTNGMPVLLKSGHFPPGRVLA